MTLERGTSYTLNDCFADVAKSIGLNYYFDRETHPNINWGNSLAEMSSISDLQIKYAAID